MQRIRITYSKGGELKFISHSELIRAFEKAVRRSGIPVAYSQGYNPHMKIDFGIPLQFGVTGDGELMDVYLETHSRTSEIMERLNATLPAGLRIISADTIALPEPSIQSRVKASTYMISFADGTGIDKKVEEILSSRTIPIMRKSKSGIKEMDIRPLIINIGLTGAMLEAKLMSSTEGTLKSSEFTSLFNGFDIKSVNRKALSF